GRSAASGRGAPGDRAPCWRGSSGRTARGPSPRRLPAFPGWWSSPLLLRFTPRPVAPPVPFFVAPGPVRARLAALRSPLAAALVAAREVAAPGARQVIGQREVDLAPHDADRLHLDAHAVAEREGLPRAAPHQPAGRLVEGVVVVGERLDADQSLDERIVDGDEDAEPGYAGDDAFEDVAHLVAQEERPVEVDHLALDLHRRALRERRLGGHLLQSQAVGDRR